jgi:VIT1/CCC1 family predicted Fe2+/Mn2+ transporter
MTAESAGQSRFVTHGNVTRAELAGIYEKKGLSAQTAREVARELTDRDAFAAHVDVELGIDPDDLSNPWQAAVSSAVAFTLVLQL